MPDPAKPKIVGKLTRLYGIKMINEQKWKCTKDSIVMSDMSQVFTLISKVHVKCEHICISFRQNLEQSVLTLLKTVVPFHSYCNTQL